MLAIPHIVERWLPVDRGGQTIHVHVEEPLWIVCYEAVETPQYVRPTYWQVYRAIEPVKRGAAVWSADNKKLAERGYPTFGEAKAAGEAWIEANRKAA